MLIIVNNYIIIPLVALLARNFSHDQREYTNNMVSIFFFVTVLVIRFLTSSCFCFLFPKCPPPTAAAAPCRHNVVFAQTLGGAAASLGVWSKTSCGKWAKADGGIGCKKIISLNNHWGGKHPNDNQWAGYSPKSNSTGILCITATVCPFCIPGIQRGIFLMIRRAS